jgi:hypothetical protein
MILKILNFKVIRSSASITFSWIVEKQQRCVAFLAREDKPFWDAVVQDDSHNLVHHDCFFLERENKNVSEAHKLIPAKDRN